MDEAYSNTQRKQSKRFILCGPFPLLQQFMAAASN
jgi:hypothetical protein